MRRITNCSQLVPADYQVQLAHFRRTIVRHREVNGYAPSNIENMDQTMVRFDSAPECTNNIRGICIATTGGEKQGFTVSSIPRQCSRHCQHKWMDDEGGGYRISGARLKMGSADYLCCTTTSHIVLLTLGH